MIVSKYSIMHYSCYILCWCCDLSDRLRLLTNTIAYDYCRLVLVNFTASILQF